MCPHPPEAPYKATPPSVRVEDIDNGWINLLLYDLNENLLNQFIRIESRQLKLIPYIGP
jgi:hypothetical protein